MSKVSSRGLPRIIFFGSQEPQPKIVRPDVADIFWAVAVANVGASASCALAMTRIVVATAAALLLRLLPAFFVMQLHRTEVCPFLVSRNCLAIAVTVIMISIVVIAIDFIVHFAE